MRKRRNNRWKFIDGFPGYLVSDDGRVLSLRCRTPVMLRRRVAATGYCQVALYRGKANTRVDKYVAVLVAKAFVRNPRKLPEVNHEDGNKMNNDYTNLKWSTRIGNVRHAKRMGLIKRKRANLIPEQAKAIMLVLQSGLKTQKQIASDFNVSEGTIQRMNTRGHRYA